MENKEIAYLLTLGSEKYQKVMESKITRLNNSSENIFYSQVPISSKDRELFDKFKLYLENHSNSRNTYPNLPQIKVAAYKETETGFADNLCKELDIAAHFTPKVPFLVNQVMRAKKLFGVRDSTLETKIYTHLKKLN